jgi:alanyl-tRNA synthetase
MTQKIYYEDQYIKNFTAEIINILEKNNEFHIALDKTAFFPGGGGQPCDVGIIEDCIITSVYEEDGIIYHISNKKPIKIHKVKCKIDWDFRFDGMQQHLGQHILSSAFLELFNINTVGFHLGKDFCTTDVDKFLSDDELEQIERLVNQHIFEGLKVELFTPTKSELKKMSLRRVPDIKEAVLRVVQVEDIDITACCGLHPKSTLEVQLLKIRRKEKAKGNMRVEFICGKRAVEDSYKKYNFTSKICKNLNCNEEEALIRIDNLTSDYSRLSYENKSLKSQIADYEVQNLLNSCERFGGISIIKDIFTDKDTQYVNLLASRLTSYDNVIALYAIKTESMAYLIFMCSKDLKVISMNDLLKDAIVLIDGKGGGSSFSAQGGGKGLNNLSSAIDYAFSKVKNTIK